MNNLRLLIVLIFPAFAVNLTAGDPEFRVLLVGDSWAEFMWDDRSLRTVFADEGHPDILEKGDVTAISGSTAADWATPASRQLITDELLANPTIDLVQLTMGGNDFLAGISGGGWFVGMPPEDEQALFDRVAGDIQTVIDHILDLDADIHIVLSFYDYPNFQESLSGLLGFFCTDLWEDLGEPTPEQINLAQVSFLDRAEQLADTIPQVSLVRHLGFMQHHFGYPSLGIPPGALDPPGDVTLPSPPEAMRFLGNDCFHLGSIGHSVLARNLWDHFYVDILCITDQQFLDSLPGWPATRHVGDLVALLDRLCP